MHARRVILPFVLLTAWGALQCGGRESLRLEEPVPQVAPGEMTVAAARAPATLDELRDRIADILAREGVPGAAIALVGRDGPIWVGGVGVRDRATGAPMAADTVFRVGSLSKSIVALGVMRLVDQGKLHLDRPLREVLPDVGIDNPWEDVAPVTLAQCLEHTAGLDDVRFNEVFTADEDLPVRDALAINPRSKRVRWRPGTRHAYSNVGYALAGRAIEVASGEPFDVYLRREVLAPLGIADADFRRTGALASRLATGYVGDRGAAFFPFAHRPSGSLLASASDLGKLVHYWIARGEGYPPIVSPAGLARIERAGTLPYPRLDADYGFANYGDVSHPVLGRGHDGGMPGFHSMIRYYPELGVGYAMSLNANYSFRGYRQLRSLVFSYLTRDRTLPRPPPAVAPRERPGAAYFAFASPHNEVFGFMEAAQTGWRVEETTAGVRLVELAGYGYELVPTADGGYRMRGEYGSSVRFTTSADGTPVMVTGFFYAEAAPGWASYVRFLAISFAGLLLTLAPVWSAAVLAYGALRRRRVLPHSLVVWPAVAGLACSAMPHCLEAAFFRGVIGEVHPLTVAVFAVTVLLAIASAATLVSAVRWSLRPDRPRLLARLVPTVCGLAFAGFSAWLGVNGLIGLRTWAW